MEKTVDTDSVQLPEGVVERIPLNSGNGFAYGMRLGGGHISLGLVNMADKSVVMRFGRSKEIRPTGTATEWRSGDAFQQDDLLIKVCCRESALVLIEVVARLLAEFPVLKEDGQ